VDEGNRDVVYEPRVSSSATASPRGGGADVMEDHPARHRRSGPPAATTTTLTVDVIAWIFSQLDCVDLLMSPSGEDSNCKSMKGKKLEQLRAQIDSNTRTR
jgi:hypothetical protein